MKKKLFALTITFFLTLNTSLAQQISQNIINAYDPTIINVYNRTSYEIDRFEQDLRLKKEAAESIKIENSALEQKMPESRIIIEDVQGEIVK